MDKIVAPIKAQDKGPAVANLQQAMLFTVEEKQLSPADHSLDQWKQVMANELGQQLFGQRTLQLMLALLPALNLPHAEFVTPPIADALNNVLAELGAFVPPPPPPPPRPPPIEETPFIVQGQVRQADGSVLPGAVWFAPRIRTCAQNSF